MTSFNPTPDQNWNKDQTLQYMDDYSDKYHALKKEGLSWFLGAFAVGILGTTAAVVAAVALGVFVGTVCPLAAPGIVMTITASLATAVAGATASILLAVWMGFQTDRSENEIRMLDQRLKAQMKA